MDSSGRPQRARSRQSVDGFSLPQPNMNPQPERADLPRLGQSIYPKDAALQRHIPDDRSNFISKNPRARNSDPKTVKRPKIKKKWSRRRKILTSILVIFILFLGVSGYYGSRIVGSLDKVFHGNLFSDVEAIFGNNVTLKGENQGRINILLAGDSSDDIGHGGADLTDSVLVASIDTQNHTAFLLSIPRDLWVYVPGMNSYQKINTANTVTTFSQPGYPSGGMGQLEQIIETQLGIPIDYYALMDYGAFRDSVNAVGGVTVDIQSSDPRGLYDPSVDYLNGNQPLVDLSNGLHTLNGQQALGLARARGDGYGSYGFAESDFQRTKDQRELFIAIAAKAKTLGIISNPSRVSALVAALGNNVQTDLSLPDVLSLVSLTKNINLNSVQSYAFSSTLTGGIKPILTDYTDPSSGEEAVIPTAGIGNYSALTAYFNQLTSNNPVVKEGASVVILNGSDVIGLASNQETALQAKGFSIAAIADASTTYSGTMIVNNSAGADPNSLQLLQKLYPGTTVTSTSSPTEATEAQGYNATFVVILGKNWDTST